MTILQRRYPLYKYAFALADLATVLAAFAAAFSLAGGRINPSMPSPLAAPAVVGLCALASVFVFHYLDLYKLNVLVTIAGHTLRLALASLLITALYALASFFWVPETFVGHRITFVHFSWLLTAGAVGIRVGLLRNLYILLARYRPLRRRVLIVGAGETGRKLAVTIFLNKHIGLEVTGFLDDALEVGTPIFRGARVVGRIDNVGRMVKALQADEILLSVEHLDHSSFMELVDRCTKTRATVKICSPLYEIVPSRLFIEHYGSLPVVNVSQSVPSPVDERSKRVFDVVLSSFALAVLAPVLLTIAFLIKLDSPGPVLYRQTRIGRNGRPFTFFKFRSMRVGSDRDEGRKRLLAAMIRAGEAVELMEQGTTKIVNKSQITRVGKWLRRTSLDELPQILNVLIGEMSLVGPRPCLPYEWENYEEWHKKRLSVPPGCTGVWQVSGRSVVGFRDMVILDLYYIQNASLPLDFKLILQTIPVMLFGKGGG
ncbi:MAG: sugar transferase [Bacteroidota bacterium]